MAVSFVTRFRRQLATIPFLIVLMVPLGLATWIWKGRKVRPVAVELNVETLCVESDPLTRSAIDACELSPELTSTK